MDSPLLANSPFHNPVLVLSDKHRQQKVLDVLKEFILPQHKLQTIIEMIREEMTLGLEAQPRRKSVFYMSNTFVTEFPTGAEVGEYLGMDLGGSNLRIVLARLRPDSEPVFLTKAYDVAMEYRRGTPEKLFDFLAHCIEDFIDSNGEDIGQKRLPFGFTFSFHVEQSSLDSALITQWSLNTEIPEALGKDAVQLMREAIGRRALNVDLLAIVNDTTSALAYGMYMRPRETRVGFVLGSGSNACYLESVDRCQSFDVKEREAQNVIINIEVGFLGDNGAVDFAKTQWDREVDAESRFPHNYSFAKLMGGLFIGDLVRRALLSLTESRVLFGGVITDALKRKDSIGGPDVSSIEGTNDSDGPVMAVLRRLGYSSPEVTAEDIAVVRHVCALVSVRNALIAAANISAVVQHIARPSVGIAIDGSLYKYHPKLQTLIADFVRVLTPDSAVDLFLADGGCCKGSALIAAVVEKNRYTKNVKNF